MIRILKASAGSGKTYALAQSYLALLTQRYAYRHILAVTFTNKATAEMKGRILKFLAESELPEHTQTLADILHDYSAFAVSTIDRFFQQALKAFAREIGQVADYQIELDRNMLVHEAMDRILDSLTDSQDAMIGWLKENVTEALDQGRKVNVEDSLYEMGERLMSEERRNLNAKYGINPESAFSKDRMAAIRKSCREIISSFTDDTARLARQLELEGRAAAYLTPYKKGYRTWEKIPRPNATLSKAAAGSAFMDLFDGRRFCWYNTAVLIRDMAFSLALAGEFHQSFMEVLKDRNVLSLDESNVILKDIIDGSDAPFVYEKLGVRYENFLLDEFQDTSNIQWENFLPLLRESNSSGHSNLVVGDVKQSIYRWRDSDWTLLATRVKEAFPDADETPLEDNWRSLRTIVNFNNAFFRMAAGAVGQTGLYADVQQNVRSKDTQEGMVRVSFCDPSEECSRVLESIADARSAGAEFGDIAILVRKKDIGKKVAAELIDAGIPVISDDSLTLKSSLMVRKIAGLLAARVNPDDKISSFLAQSENVDFPEQYHSLVDLCEYLFRKLDTANPGLAQKETLYIQAFMDDLREWVDANGNDLRYYMQHWNENDRTIGSPADEKAVRIITVHKSKGLQFPYLIFPFAEKVEIYRPDCHWCHLDPEGTPFAPETEGIYPVVLSSQSEDTLFRDDYEREKQMQTVDNINLFYVALTRAEKCLHVIAANPSKTFVNSMDKVPAYGNFSHVLFKFCGGSKETLRGSMYDFTKMDREESEAGRPLPYSFSSTALGDRLRVSSDAADFFGEDGSTGPSASPRRSGIALHGILSRVQVPSDIASAVEDAVVDGQLSADEGENALRLLSSRVSAHAEWFRGEALNETTVFDANGTQRRPDRVVMMPEGSIVVVDYKFGEPSDESTARYRRQVASYCRIFREMGYKNVSGAVWYVVSDITVPVN